MAAGTRERIVHAGLELFEQHGFAHVGLDQVLQQAELTKTTFYNHFESKEDLVRAALNQRESEVDAQIKRILEEPGDDDPGQRLLGFFDILHHRFGLPQVSRCLLMCAMIEFSGTQDPIFKTAIAYRNRRIESFRQLAVRAGVAEPDRFSIKFAMLVDGAVVEWQVANNQNAAKEAKQVATLLLRESIA